MELSRSPESPNRNLRKISLPAAIKTFYTQRGRFIRGLPGYEQVEGLFPEDHNDFFDFRYGFPKPLKESHPVNNLDQDAYERAQTHTKQLLKLFFRVPEKALREPLREYMLTGGTKPIRVSSEVNDNGRRVYVKLPSVERIVGLSLYNIISPEPPIDFLFSEYIFVEDSVRGAHIDDTNVRHFQQIPELPEQVVKLAVQDRFLGINDLDRAIDLPNRPGILVNIIVQSKGQVITFDADCAFTTLFPEYDIVGIFRKKGVHIHQSLEKEVTKAEAQRIMRIIHGTSRKPYQRYIEMMDKIDILKEQLSNLKCDSAKDYFDKKEAWL